MSAHTSSSAISFTQFLLNATEPTQADWTGEGGQGTLESCPPRVFRKPGRGPAQSRMWEARPARPVTAQGDLDTGVTKRAGTVTGWFEGGRASRDHGRCHDSDAAKE